MATAGIAFAVRALRPDTSPAADGSPSPTAQTSPIPALTGDPWITAEIPLVDDERHDSIGGVAVGAGSAWVGLQRADTDSVVRIDLATNEVVAEIPVRKTPFRKRIVATDQAVWVASTGVLQRIDPVTNTIVASVDLQGRPISAITAGAASVWAVAMTEPSDEGGEWSGSLVRVDPATNAIVAEIPLGPQVAGYEDGVMLGSGSVWVLGVRWFEEDDAEYGSDLIRIDPATNSIAARIPVGGFHMVMGTDEVWVRFPADGVFDALYAGERGERWLWTRVDVRTNEPSEPFEFDDNGLRLVTREALWSVGYDEQENVRVTRFDPETLEMEVRSEPIHSYFHDAVLDPASGTVWVSAVWNVVRVDIADEVAPSPSGAPPAANVVYLAPYLAGGEGWYTRSSGPARAGDATVAWASSIPFEAEHEAIAIPVNTIAALPPDGIVITALTVTSGYDLSLGPFPFDLSGLALSAATVRGPDPEEPPGDYSVFEIYYEPALIRVYVGTPSPSERLIERAQRELDTLQLPPVCPVPAEGWYAAELSADLGAPGDLVAVSGPMPFQHKDGSYDTSGETRMILWWNASPEDWLYLSSFSDASPRPPSRARRWFVSVRAAAIAARSLSSSRSRTSRPATTRSSFCKRAVAAPRSAPRLRPRSPST